LELAESENFGEFGQEKGLGELRKFARNVQFKEVSHGGTPRGKGLEHDFGANAFDGSWTEVTQS
jgi:hypothetical protein